MLQPVLLGISGTCTLVFRWGDVEAVTQRELDTTRIVVLHFPGGGLIAIKFDMVDASIEEVVTCQFDIETVLEEVFADTEREHGIGAVNPNVWACIAVRYN